MSGAYLIFLVEWHELLIVHEVVGIGVLVFLVFIHVETDHTSHSVLSDLLLPRLFRSGQCDFDFSVLSGVQPEMEFGISPPRHIFLIFLVLLVIQMTSTSIIFRPAPTEDCILGIFELLDFNFLG